MWGVCGERRPKLYVGGAALAEVRSPAGALARPHPRFQVALPRARNLSHKATARDLAAAAARPTAARPPAARGLGMRWVREADAKLVGVGVGLGSSVEPPEPRLVEEAELGEPHQVGRLAVVKVGHGHGVRSHCAARGPPAKTRMRGALGEGGGALDSGSLEVSGAPCVHRV